jgi:membrane-associated phospholipid phosphatase
MVSKFLKIIFFIVFVYFLFISMQPARYYIWYPTIQSAYPNNAREIGIIVRDYLSMRTPENIQFFRLTDASPLEAFRGKISDEQFQRLKKEIVSPRVIGKIMYYKKLYNRARPAQVAPELVLPLYSSTADTPAFPSGHAFQGYYAAKILSKWMPKRKKEWDAIAERCANIRIIAGLHYPSDRDFAKKLIDKL